MWAAWRVDSALSRRRGRAGLRGAAGLGPGPRRGTQAVRSERALRECVVCVVCVFFSSFLRVLGLSMSIAHPGGVWGSQNLAVEGPNASGAWVGRFLGDTRSWWELRVFSVFRILEPRVDCGFNLLVG